jgi:PAS domain S-box-containing protein
MSKAGILIVEDSFIVAFHLRKTLEKEGYLVAGSEASGEEALLFLEKNRPDVVLMDIMLNGQMDGIETARTIRSRFNLPVIYLTALSDRETIQRAKITEPFGYLTKPFEERELFTAIEIALYKHEIESRLRQSEEKYFSTVKSISDAVVVIDEQYRVVYMNPVAEMQTDSTLNESNGQSIFDLLKLKDAVTHEFPVNPFQSVLDQGKINSFPSNLLLVSKRGKETPIGEGSMSAIANSKGRSLGMVIIFKDLSEKMAHERLAKEFEKKHLAALLEGQEQERSRIAKDLHDGLGQLLNAIKMNIDLLGIRDQKMNTLSELVDDAIQESVRISENLLPAKLKDFNLATCLRSLCATVSRTSGVPVSFECLSDGEEDIEQNQKINLYRIAQEAINNALKHSKANIISVQLNQEEPNVQLMVEDDGVGFQKHNPYDQSVHHGLVNMRERAEIMGGKLTIESDADRGTLIIVEAPVNNKNSIYAQA